MRRVSDGTNGNHYIGGLRLVHSSVLSRFLFSNNFLPMGHDIFVCLFFSLFFCLFFFCICVKKFENINS
jgi:hypothetical protein